MNKIKLSPKEKCNSKRKFKIYKRIICSILVLAIFGSLLPSYIVHGTYLDDNYYFENDYQKTFLSTDCTNYSGIGDVRFLIHEICTDEKHGEIWVSGYVGDKKEDVEIVLPETVEIQGYLYDLDYIPPEVLNYPFITSITIPNSVTVIGANAFISTSIKEINIPASVKTIDWYAFGESVEKITVDKDNKYFMAEDNVLYSKDQKILYAAANKTKNYTIKDGVEIIETGAFSGCCNTSMHNPIYSISKLTIPKSVKVIKEDALSAWLIEFLAPNPPKIEEHISTNIIVPKESIDKYKKLKYSGEKVFDTVGTEAHYLKHNKKALRETLKLQGSTTRRPDDVSKKEYKYIKSFTKKLVQNANSDEEKVLIIYNWIVNNCYWDKNRIKHTETSSYLISDYVADRAYNCLKNKYMVPLGFANLVNAMMRSVDIPSIYIVDGKNYPFLSMYFVSNLVYINDKWWYLDVSTSCENEYKGKKFKRYYDKVNNISTLTTFEGMSSDTKLGTTKLIDKKEYKK